MVRRDGQSSGINPGDDNDRSRVNGGNSYDHSENNRAQSSRCSYKEQQRDTYDDRADRRKRGSREANLPSSNFTYNDEVSQPQQRNGEPSSTTYDEENSSRPEYGNRYVNNNYVDENGHSQRGKSIIGVK